MTLGFGPDFPERNHGQSGSGGTFGGVTAPDTRSRARAGWHDRLIEAGDPCIAIHRCNKYSEVNAACSQAPGVKACTERERPVSAVTHIYSAIDALAALTRPANAPETTRDLFLAWVQRLVPLGELGVSAIELYGARCGVLHTYCKPASMHTRLTCSITARTRPIEVCRVPQQGSPCDRSTHLELKTDNGTARSPKRGRPRRGKRPGRSRRR